LRFTGLPVHGWQFPNYQRP